MHVHTRQQKITAQDVQKTEDKPEEEEDPDDTDVEVVDQTGYTDGSEEDMSQYKTDDLDEDLKCPDDYAKYDLERFTPASPRKKTRTCTRGQGECSRLFSSRSCRRTGF